MSLPLRHPLEDATSLDRVLEDLIVRFIINCPPEDFSSVERELFHVEEASWFYTDFVILMNPNLPNMRIKSFAQNVIKLCPLVWKWDVKADQALKKFSQYKKSIPVRGAAIFNKSLTKILLVKGTESDSWSFPRGKISKDEDDVDCCIREVQEEIGYDITDHIDEDQFIERNIQGKNYKIFLVSGVPEDFDFKPKVRNEIEKIEWRDFRKLSRSIHKPNVKYYLVNAMIRPMAVWIKSRKGVKDDDQLKSHVEEQLKLLLGIKKDDTADPGRELLNMLQGAATSSKPEQVEQAVQDGSPSQVQQPLQQPPISGVPFMVPPPQFQQQFPFMGFQPFAPFPFNNGVGVPPGVAPLPPSSPGVQIQAPPTPSLNVLAKPTVAEEAEKGGAAPSKVLLDLLNENDDQREQTRPKIKLLKRGEMLEDQQKPADFVNNSSYIQQDPNANGNSTDANALLTLLKRPIKTAQTEGSALLKMIQKPAESTANPKEEHYNSSSALETSSLEQSNTNESEYEDFESCSSMGDEEDEEFEEDEEDEEDLAEEMSKEVEENEEEKLEKLEQKEKSSGNESQEALKQNFFVPGSVPHVDPHNMSDLSTGGAVDLKSLKSQAKPKIKILKRGETLKDIAFESRNASESSTNGPEPMHSHQQDSKDLLNMLKKTQMIAMEEVRQSLEKSRMLNSPELLPRPNSALTESKHQTESVGPPVRSTDTFAEAHNTDKSMISPESSDPFTSDSADLLSLLKKPTRTHQSPLAGQTPIVGSVDQFVSDRDHDSKELLTLLKKTETSSTPGYNEAEKVATTPTETTYPENNVSTAHELLNVLKNGSIPTMPAKTSIYKEESRGPVTGSSDLSSSYSTPVVVSSPLHEQMRMPATNGMNMEPYQTPSQNLLQMLKHPRPAEQYDYTMNAPFHNGIPRDQPQVNNQSSNELLALLQKK